MGDARKLRLSEIERHRREVENGLGEMSLKLIDSFVEEKSELVRQYERMVEIGRDEHDEARPAADECLAEVRAHVALVDRMRKRALEQRERLAEFLRHLDRPDEPEERTVAGQGDVCPMCGMRFEYLPFDQFALHVENHFKEYDAEAEPSDFR